MRDFACPHCGQRLAFENSQCLRCGFQVAFDLDTVAFALVAPDDTAVGDPARSRCGNKLIAKCNWLAPAHTDLCRSCSLTRTRPADSDSLALAEFAVAETAKRRLVLELTELDLPIIDRSHDPDRGLTFDLLSSEHQQVITGHADGLITLDLAESDDVHREQLRVSMDEPYRTLLGHFRHEIGHYYFFVLVDGRTARRSDPSQKNPARKEFERLFGDPDSDYQAAIDRHYSQGAPAGWEQTYVSSYATMHPAEDWAETFAHYLHIRDTLDTAAAFGLAPAAATLSSRLAGRVGFDRIMQLWVPMTWSLNMINRSMGHADLYPFVLAPTVLEKIAFVHSLVVG